MSSHKSIEDSYCISDEDVKKEHVAGSNRYTFKYNHQWRNIIHEHLTVSVRSIKLWLAPRFLFVRRLNVHTKDGTEPTGFTATITGPMTELNDQLKNMYSAVGYQVYYNPTNRRLVFDCADDNYFDYTDPADIQARISDDLKVITGQENFSNVVVYNRDANNHIVTFYFENIWDRQNVHVSASFVDLGYNKFLGVSNEQFIPPKEYPISFTDQKFTIELYDSLNKPVEIPALDNKDTLLLELILNSYS